ncbi:MAG: hypothetical protein NTV48_03355 [Candidatus Vogelbacteria bacterium]|nr:hypothetical protein [Candidatus Vogelbacteria bacterium]
MFLWLEAVILPLLGVLNYLAFKNYWYWRYPWFDKPMHFLGGLALGFFGLITYIYFFNNPAGVRKIDWKMWPISLSPTLLIGIIWEGLEFKASKIYVANVYLKTFGMFFRGGEESLKDLMFDFIGALSAILLFLIIILCQKKK